MSRKLPISLVLLLFAVSAFAQTIVSTTPENKKVILEEFTGINCVFCPQGHAIAQALQDANPGNVFLINIHQGSFANPNGSQPDFRTPWGNAIANQSDLAGYPAGTVNRHVFPGQGQNTGSTAMSRNVWTSTANQILAEPSYVNVAVEAELDVQTSEIVVHVEAYYTGNSPIGTNLLSVALLQNNTLGPQTGGGAGNNYVHQHRLIDLLTGQWGISIPATSTGTFVDETFTFTVPGDYNGIDVEFADLEVVAFVTETTQEIASGSGAYPTYTGINNANDASIKSITEIIDQCQETISPVVKIQNLGQDPITALDISYDINGGTTEVYNWTGNLTSLQSATIELPAISYAILANNVLTITIPNDDENSNNMQTEAWDQSVHADGNLVLTVNTDAYGSEVRWNIRDGNNMLVETGGPYGNNQQYVENIQVPVPTDCYVFTLIDTYGDGGGPVTLEDANGLVVFSTNGDYGSGFPTNFSSDGVVLGVDENVLDAVTIYPNPAKNILNIVNAENATIEVFNILGQAIYSKANISMDEQVNVANLTTGTYFVKITNGTAVTTEKFVIAR